METNNRSYLATEPVGRLLLRLAVPTVIAQLVNMLYNIVDRIYIGHMPENGSMALTGVGVCMPLIMILTAFAALIVSGGAPRASICMGRGNQDEAEKILGNCFSAQIIISVLLTAVMLMQNRELLTAFGASENTIEYAVEYMNIYAMGTIFVQLTLGMNAFITAQGATKTSMTTVLIGAVVNILLDPVFIYALGMGVRGAALATVISQAISCAWVLAFLGGRKTALHLRTPNMKIDPRLLLSCIALGSSAFIMQGSESAITACFNSSLLRYGGDTAVGAMTIMSSVMQFAMLPMQGIAQGAQPISGYNYGAGNTARVRATFRLLLITCVTYSTLLWAAIQLAPRFFAGIFTTDAALLDFTAGAMRVYFAVLLLFGIQIACQMTFVSIGSAVCSIIVAVMRKFVLLLPLIYILPHLVANKTTGVYLAEPIADALAITFTSVLFAVQFKKAMKALEK